MMRAMQRISEGRDILPEDLRAAAARAVAGLNLPVTLVATFAADSLAVSAPIIAAARLDAAQWDMVLDGVSDETRAFAETIHPELRKAPKAKKADLEPAPALQPPPARPRRWKPPEEEAPKISEMVARIERMRRTRAPAMPEPLRQPPNAMPPMSGDSPALFRWECGPSGDIAWVEGAPRGALIGRSIALAGNGDGEGVDRAVERAFALRSPFRDASFSLAGDGILSGRWRISGVPAFEPADGRFAGYRGVARREEAMPPPPGSAPPPPPSPDHDSLRELVHEIKTPLNAIIGFAEIIDGQYLGPAHRGYRERAAEIVSQARTLLSAIDDLDFAAKLQSSRSSPGEGSDFAEILPRLSEEFSAYAASRGSEILIRMEGEIRRCALDSELAERLVRRFVESVINSSAPSEMLALGIGSKKGMCSITVTRPRAIREVADEQLFDPGFALDPDDKLGIGFALRLVRGLARIAGGDLQVEPERLALLMPAARPS